MEKNFISSDSVIELEFLTEIETLPHTHEAFELLYLLSGNMCVNIEDEEFSLNPRDMLVINPNKRHSYRGDSDMFTARFIISYSRLCDLLEQDIILFWCNSVVDKNEAYDQMREIITQILNQYNANDPRGHIYLKSLYYQLLHVLTSNFLLTSSDIRFQSEKDKTDDRMQEIMQYLRANYRQNISLHDLAEKMYLSTAYLSKYIKKSCGVSYMELINSVRLDRSMEALIYTDASVMKIAMDCGFASVAAYNKVFREKYSATPSEFRKKVKEKNQQDKKEKIEKYQNAIRKKVQIYLDTNQSDKNRKQHHFKNKVLNLLVSANECTGKEWNYIGNRMINIGTATDLGRSAFRTQLLFLKERLKTEYVRFWDVFDPAMYLDIHAGKGRIHFGRLDEVLDFLVQNGMKPYMELGFKPLRILKTTKEALVEIQREQDFYSDEEMQDFFSELIEHFVKRYGAEEVQNWYFEYWKREDITFDQNMSFKYMPMSEASQRQYFHRFDIIAKSFKAVLPGARLGGGGFSLQHYGRDGFQNILKWWHQAEYHPDFLSFNCYPYQIQQEGGIFFEKKSTDLYFIKHNLELIHSVLTEEKFPKTEIHISEYSLTLSNRNAVNDSCAKGAFLMQNAIACMNGADMFGYWLGFDSYADFSDAQRLLFGGCGIITKTGVPKPAFYAFEFLNKMHGMVYSAGNNYVLTGNGRDSFRMICHNFTGFNYNYYLTDEDKIRIQNIPIMMDDMEDMSISVQISDIRDGIYIIKTMQVNQQYGSVQDEWVKLNLETELNMQEQDYLKKICVPRLQIRRQKTVKNVLTFDMMLAPNEICYLHLIYAGE